MFTERLRNADHTRHFSIVSTPKGWEVRREEDSRVVRLTEYQDWHRVERARRSIAHEVSELEAAGWQRE